MLKKISMTLGVILFLMCVNRGVALSGIPFRFNCSFEITLIKLSR